MNIVWIYCLILVVHVNHIIGRVNNICCTPDQWEGLAYLGYGTVFPQSETISEKPRTALTYINGTTKLAYDWTNSRTYMFVNGTEQSPLLPAPGPITSLMIADYKLVSYILFILIGF